ncbi:MAG: tRNA (N6-isopentenyl adenosine(37)-C2)-methylthiotransferase MiaB [Candidatus Omnitrophota bacterium]|jgi:tRNA-2-methylthio-N6-dimethylallyladenosine synthase
MKKVFIRTFGCQMNVRDSEVTCGLLKEQGYQIIDNPQKADIVIFNTCSVRQHAEDKVWSEIGRLKNNGKATIIGLVGCMAQNYKERIFQRAANVDFVVGPSDIHTIPGIIKTLTAEQSFERKIWETDGDSRPEEIYHTAFYQDKEHAYVVISEGCSNFCSYCIVPYVRGALRSRNYQDILKEIKQALAQGITRITLLGQNVNAYKSAAIGSQPAVDFIDLLKMVNEIKGLKEFSFITSHPKDTSLELFKAMAGLEKLKKYLHLPAQSGSDRILRAMNRGYTKKFYLDLADNYRKIVKAGVLTADIIVGFPSESAQDFQDTYDLVKEAEFNAAYIFKYSPRPHTQAESLPDDVERTEKERRHKLILDLQKNISRGKDAKKNS